MMDKQIRTGVVGYSLAAIIAATLSLFAIVNSMLWVALGAGLIAVMLLIMIVVTARRSN